MDKQVIAKNFKEKEAEYINKGYQRKDESISLVKANIMALITAGPFIVLGIVLWIVIKKELTITIEPKEMLIFITLSIISIFVHECLHGLGWVLFTNSWKSIHIGLMKSSLTPYCHCNEPLQPKRYFIGVLTPFMILGILGYILAFILNSGVLLAISLFSILGAGGDTTIALMEMKYLRQKDCYILDHPTKCGFIVFKK